MYARHGYIFKSEDLNSYFKKLVSCRYFF
ncbi:YARHG domain-containing protein [Neobacillus sp. C211]